MQSPKTFKMCGIAYMSAETANLRPWFLLMILRGFKTLRSLRALKLLRFSINSVEQSIEKVTIIKSIAFHQSLRNESLPLKRNPSVMILAKISAVKIDVKTISELITILLMTPFGSLRGLSRASIML